MRSFFDFDQKARENFKAKYDSLRLFNAFLLCSEVSGYFKNF